MDEPLPSTPPVPARAPDVPLPPGLPPLEPRTHLLWWQGLVAMVVAVAMLVVANLGVALPFLLKEAGTAGLGELMADEERFRATFGSFPLVAAGQAANLLVFLVVAALAPFAARVPHRSALGLRGAPAGVFALGAVGILGLSPLADRLTRVLKPFFPEQGTLEMIEAALAGQPLYLLVPFLAVMPALGEELLCRGVLQRSFRSPWVALPVSALFFTALHFDPVHMAGVLPLGFYLAWLGYRSQSTWVPIAAHFTNNLAATLAMYGSVGVPAEDTELPLWAVPAGLFVTLACAYGLHALMRGAAARAPTREDLG